MFPYFPAIKLGAKFVAGFGVSTVVREIIKNNVTPATAVASAKIWVGTAVLSAIAIEQTRNYIDRFTDEMSIKIETLKQNTEAEK